MKRTLVNLWSLLLCLCLLLAGCGGGSNGGSSGGSGVAPPTATLAAKDVVAMDAPYDLAVVGETYSEQMPTVSGSADLTITGYRIEPTTAAAAKTTGMLDRLIKAAIGAGPSINSTGLITWTPAESDVGIHSFDVTAIANNGTEQKITIQIEVAKRLPLINITVGNEGGTFTDAEGEYTLVIPANAVETGISNITAKISAIRRADGREELRENVDGVNSDVGYMLLSPMRPSPDPIDTDNVVTAHAASKSAYSDKTDSGLYSIETYKGILYKGENNTSINIFLRDSNGNDNIAVLDGSCRTKSECGVNTTPTL